MLCSLQSSDPPALLLDVLYLSKKSLEENISPLQAVKTATMAQLEANKNFISMSFNMHEKAFPVDEPIARGIRGVIEQIRKNISQRYADPFFELDIIERISKEVTNYNDIIREYGGCSVVQERSGYNDQLERDLLYSFIHNQSDGDWQIFHAAFRYLYLHIDGKTFIPSSTMASKNIKKQCPFYTSCNLQLRQNNSNICSESPWEAEHWQGWDQNHITCWYGMGVRQTRPRED